jgi:hypothetical protein
MALVFGGGSTSERQALSRKVKSGNLVKIHSGIYTDETTRDPGAIVRENLWEIAAHLFPGGVISHRSSLDPRPTHEGLFFVTHKRNRRTEIHGITFVEMLGPGPIEGDRQVASFNIYQSHYERSLLENLQVSKSEVAKSLGRGFVEKELYDRLLRGGDTELNKIRDACRKIAIILDMEREFNLLNAITGGPLSTMPAKGLSTNIGQAMAKGEPFDVDRLKMFESLAIDLDKVNFPHHPMPTEKSTNYNFSFFEAYFSNYIEGTILTVDEAKKVIETNAPLPNKRNDSHDVLATFKITSDLTEMSIVPKNVDDLIKILQRRHAVLLQSRTEKSPGLFKEINNQAGAYQFVDHRLVVGTFRNAFKFYEYLKDPTARAFFIMFLVAEVHPFEDGNGRIARLMMNAELTAAKLCKTIIPTVYRTDYLGALRAMSNNFNSIPFSRMLTRACDFSATVTQPGFQDCLDYLEKCNAFETEQGVILRF